MFHQDPSLFKLLRLKTQICLSCFGSTNLGHPASFQSSDGLFNLDVWLWFSFPPLILSFHRPCAPRRPRWSLSHYFGRDPSHSMHLANEFGLTALASVSSSRPPQLGICCCRCFVWICFGLFNCMSWPVLVIVPVPLCSWLKGAPPGTLPKQQRAKKNHSPADNDFLVNLGLVPRPPLQKPPSRGLEVGGEGGGDEGLKVEGGFTFGRLQGGLKGASSRLHLEGGLKGASRGLQGGLKGAWSLQRWTGLWRGLQGGFTLKGAWRGLKGAVKYVPKQSIPKHFEHELHQRFGHV